MAQGNLERLHSLSSNGHTPHIVISSSHLDFHCPISHASLLCFHDVVTIIITVNCCTKLHCSSTWFIFVSLFSSSKMRYSNTTPATMVVSINGKVPTSHWKSSQQCNNQTNHYQFNWYQRTLTNTKYAGLRGVLYNQKSACTTRTTCTMPLRCPSSHMFHDFVDCVVHRVNAPHGPLNQCEYWRELGWSLQKKDE